MPVSTWSTQQLAEFLAAVSSCESEASAALAAVERAAEALDAEVAAIVCDDGLVAAVGYPDGAAPVAELRSLALGSGGCELWVPGVGMSPATCVPLDHPPGATLVVSRSGSDGMSPEEAGLLRGMARVTSMTMRMLRLLEDERAAREQLTASRARIVATADEVRRRIERDLHDGIQQRLVALALGLRGLGELLPPERPELRAQVSELEDQLGGVIEELREIARGVHPGILSKGGLAAALKAIARRSALPLQLDVGALGRLPEPVEVAAYYTVSEALANAAKHANASVVKVSLRLRGRMLRVMVDDNGVGGADPAHGSGILGLTDRVEALGGRLELTSPPRAGTAILVELPAEAR
jgi:signal transduction histidine kinase